MSRITRLQAGKKNSNRVNLYLDDQFSFALSIDEVARNHLTKGLVLSEDQIARLKRDDETEYIYAKILNFLSYRPRSEFEVRARLRQYQCDDIDSIVTKLKDNSHLSDLAFAQWFVSSRTLHKTRSPHALRAELTAKGIDRVIIDQVLEQLVDPRVTIRRILAKKLKFPSRMSLPTRQKIYGYLLRQGFAWNLVQEVVKTWESE